jgi:hypothetical protein
MQKGVLKLQHIKAAQNRPTLYFALFLPLHPPIKEKRTGKKKQQINSRHFMDLV